MLKNFGMVQVRWGNRFLLLVHWPAVLRKRHVQFWLLMCGLLLTLQVGTGGRGFAQELGGPIQEVLEYQSQGSINWSSGMLEATGIGVPPEGSRASASVALAARAAKAVALRNLLELVQGIRIDSTTTVKNYQVASDEVQARVAGVVQHARVIKQILLPDGSVELTLSLDMWGEPSVLNALAGVLSLSAPIITDSIHVEGEAYTGIIVDARGLGVQPVAFPSLLDSEGNPLVELDGVIQQKSRRRGGAQYFSFRHSSPLGSLYYLYTVGEKAAVQLPTKRVGPRPLQVKGVGKDGDFQGNIILSEEDVRKIRGNPSLMKAMEQGRVIIVTDPLIAGIEG